MNVEAIDQHIQAIQHGLKERSRPQNGSGERLPAAAAEELCAALEDLRRQSQDLFARQSAELAEAKQREATLRRREQELADFVENAAMGLRWVGPDGTILWANSAELELLGYSPDEYIGHHLAEFHVDQEVIDDILAKLTAGMTLPNYEARLLCKDGSIKHVLISSNVCWEDGKFIHSRCFTRDITDRKQAEAALRASEERFRALIENNLDGIELIGADGHSLYVSPSVTRILGYADTELRGSGIRLDRVHRDDVERVIAFMAELVQHPRQAITTQYRFRHKDGAWRWIEAVANDLLGEPATNAIVVNFRDITERKQAEDELRRQAARAEALAHTAARLNAVRDRHALINAVCEETVRALNVPLAAIYLAGAQDDGLRCAAGYGLPPNWGERLSASPLAAYEALVRRTGPTTVIPDVQAIPNLPNADLSVELNARTVATAAMFDDDRLIGFLGVSTTGSVREFAPDELSLLKSLADQAALAIVKARLFDEVRDGQAQLRALSRRLLQTQETERRHIARELHDEVGQTLTGLKLLIDMCAHLPANAAAPRLADAQSLIDDLMDRIHRLSLDLRPTMLDDLGLLPTLLSHTERYTAQTGMRVNFEHAGLERRFPPAIETAAYRIVQEALTNVARHAGVREVNVRVWAGPDTLCAQIDDQGAGFDAAAVLAGYATSGLAGMRERAALLGGELTIDSTPGAGTHIVAELPLRSQGQAQRA